MRVEHFTCGMLSANVCFLILAWCIDRLLIAYWILSISNNFRRRYFNKDKTFLRHTNIKCKAGQSLKQGNRILFYFIAFLIMLPRLEEFTVPIKITSLSPLFLSFIATRPRAFLINVDLLPEVSKARDWKGTHYFLQSSLDDRATMPFFFFSPPILRVASAFDCNNCRIQSCSTYSKEWVEISFTDCNRSIYLQRCAGEPLRGVLRDIPGGPTPSFLLSLSLSTQFTANNIFYTFFFYFYYPFTIY